MWAVQSGAAADVGCAVRSSGRCRGSSPGAAADAGKAVQEQQPAHGSSLEQQLMRGKQFWVEISARKMILELTLEQLRASTERTGGLEPSGTGCWTGVWSG
eukprot:g33178.t1